MARRQEAARPPSPHRRLEPLPVPSPRRRRLEPQMLNDMDIQQERVPTLRQRVRPRIPVTATAASPANYGRLSNQHRVLPDNIWSNEVDSDLNPVNDFLTSSRGRSPVESVGQASSAGGNTSFRDDDAVQTLIQQLEGQLAKEKEDKLCVVCLDKPRNVMLRPCNHYCVCETCVRQLLTRKCPICQKRFSSSEKIFSV